MDSWKEIIDNWKENESEKRRKECRRLLDRWIMKEKPKSEIRGDRRLLEIWIAIEEQGEQRKREGTKEIRGDWEC